MVFLHLLIFLIKQDIPEMWIVFVVVDSIMLLMLKITLIHYSMYIGNIKIFIINIIIRLCEIRLVRMNLYDKFFSIINCII